MPHLPGLSRNQLTAFHADARSRYDGFARRGVTLNLTRGKPSTKQLDLSNALLTLPGEGDFISTKIDARNYGDLQGLPDLRDLLAPLFGVTGDRVILGNNSSLALMHDTIVFALLRGVPEGARPWSKDARVAFLCPVPGYDRHFALCQQFGIELISVPLLDDGPDMDAVEAVVAEDAGIKGMWCVPKYANPSGAVYSEAKVERLAKMKTAAKDFRLFWDNAYAVHHLTEERVEIANIDTLCATHGNPNRALIFGSTSKITFAGAGVSLVAGSKENVTWFMKQLSFQTIGGDKMNQLRHLRYLKTTDGIFSLMDRHRAIMAPKFDKVLDLFQQHLGGTGIASWTRPKGGYFISLDVLDGCAKRVVQLAKEAGVELTPAGATHPYGKDPNDRTIRIAPTFPEPDEVEQAAEGVALSVLVAGAEKLLS